MNIIIVHIDMRDLRILKRVSLHSCLLSFVCGVANKLLVPTCRNLPLFAHAALAQQNSIFGSLDFAVM